MGEIRHQALTRKITNASMLRRFVILQKGRWQRFLRLKAASFSQPNVTGRTGNDFNLINRNA